MKGHPLISEGVVLRKSPYGEADAIVSALLREGGVKRMFAPAARKSSKRFGGRLDVFSRLKFSYRPRSGGLDFLEGVEEAAPSEGGRLWERDLRAFAFFQYFSEMICEFSPEEAGTPEAFAIWEEAASAFSRGGFRAAAAWLALRRFLGASGYALAWEKCAGCGGEPEGARFSPAEGGVFCAACAEARRIGSGREIGAALRRAIQDDTGTFAVPHGAENLFAELAAFARCVLQKHLRAEAFFLETLRGE